MTRRRRWLCGIVLALLGTTVLAALLEPTHTVRGLLAGEPFYRERSLGYWREVLREHGREGNIPSATARYFRDGQAAFPVLRACAHDPDRNVRWPAVFLLGYSGLRTEPVLEVLVNALEDEDIEVRLKAVSALTRWGPAARQAVPALTARLHDPEIQVVHYVDLALWQIDEAAAAAAACGYRRFHSPEFGFSVMLPGEPEREDRPAQGGVGVAHSFQQSHHAGPQEAPVRYVVLVVDYPEASMKGVNEQERFRRTKDSLPLFTGGRLVEEKAVSLGELSGREYVLEFGGQGRLLSRQFWAGPRLYAVMVAYKPEFLNARAAGYFLDSFRLDEEAERRPQAPRSSR